VNSPRYWAIVPAAGSGKRVGGERPKQYLPLLDKPSSNGRCRRCCASHAFRALLLCWRPTTPLRQSQLALAAKVRTAIGGAERVDSVRAGLTALAQDAKPEDWVLVHDAARPCLTDSDLTLLLHSLADDAVGGLLATPIVDTLKQADTTQHVAATMPRAGLWRALTPQMFRFSLLTRALEQARVQNIAVTDEAEAIERSGHASRLIAGRSDNIKITAPEICAWRQLF